MMTSNTLPPLPLNDTQAVFRTYVGGNLRDDSPVGYLVAAGQRNQNEVLGIPVVRLRKTPDGGYAAPVFKPAENRASDFSVIA